MEPKIKQTLTFDDVLIEPAESKLEPSETNPATSCARNFFISKPILSAPMDTATEAEMAIALGNEGGLGVVHRNCRIETQCEFVATAKASGVRVGAACSPFDIERAKALVEVGVDLIAIDSAHGHNHNVISGAKKIKEMIGDVPLVVGNIATASAAKELVAFADGIKVGVGPGSICITRVVSGVGVPQLSAIMAVASVAKEYNVPVIADGGIRTSGDIAKAIAAGASAVMLGNLLGATVMAPGEVFEENGRKYKQYRGMGSKAVLSEGRANDRYLGKTKNIVPEGVSGKVPVVTDFPGHINGLVGGLQVAMGYVGAKTINEFQAKANFIQITEAGARENAPHTLVDYSV